MTYKVTVVFHHPDMTINDLPLDFFTHYVYAGVEHTLSVPDAVSYRLISEGHAEGTYIDGDKLYVDEHETVSPVIEVKTSYGVVVQFGVVDPIEIKGADQKWLLLCNRNEPYENMVAPNAPIVAYYEGNQVYVRIEETDEWTDSVMSPEYPEGENWYAFYVYANTKADGTGVSRSWSLFLYY